MDRPTRPFGRHTPRAPGFEDRAPNAYLLTICTKNRRRLLGEVRAAAAIPCAAGRAVLEAWRAIPLVHRNVEIGAAVVMPDHFHGILTLHAPLPNEDGLTDVVRKFKARATAAVRALPGLAGVTLWQRSFHERLLVDDRAIEKAREYVAANPWAWVVRGRG